MDQRLVTNNDQSEHYCCLHDGKRSITGTCDLFFSLENEQNSSPVFSCILLNSYSYLFAKLQSVELLPDLLLSSAS
jgi:hypothetical protein